MSKLNEPLTFETTFDVFVADEIIGEGGAGRVYGATVADGTKFAIKVLAKEFATTEKRRRFKNEIAFLSRNQHQNIISVIDHGVSSLPSANGPFYVMPRFDCSLREVLREGLTSEKALRLFSQALDGVEAAHLLQVVHRDLKPENLLYNRGAATLAIADFGIARFTKETVETLVETGPSRRLANFVYAAPEQRSAGQSVTETADVYALGLILNEMFTGVVPHGTNYHSIGSVDGNFTFLDAIVKGMLAQSPSERPQSITEVKSLIGRYRDEAITRQRISAIDGAVIKSGEIDDPLALDAPRLVGFDWERGWLTLILDRPVTTQWIGALQHMQRFTSLRNKPPISFRFKGNRATIEANEGEVRPIIDYFKSWLPVATETLMQSLKAEAQQLERKEREKLRRERDEEEIRLRVLRSTKI